MAAASSTDTDVHLELKRIGSIRRVFLFLATPSNDATTPTKTNRCLQTLVIMSHACQTWQEAAHSYCGDIISNELLKNFPKYSSLLTSRCEKGAALRTFSSWLFREEVVNRFRQPQIAWYDLDCIDKLTPPKYQIKFQDLQVRAPDDDDDDPAELGQGIDHESVVIRAKFSGNASQERLRGRHDAADKLLLRHPRGAFREIAHQVGIYHHCCETNSMTNRLVEVLGATVEERSAVLNEPKPPSLRLHVLFERANHGQFFEFIRKSGASAFSYVRLVDYARQMAEALAALHASGWVHCNLKPSKILVHEPQEQQGHNNSDVQIKLCGCGVDAHQISEIEQQGLCWPRSQTYNTFFCSREHIQAMRDRDYDRQFEMNDDVWSFGSIIVTMVQSSWIFDMEEKVAVYRYVPSFSNGRQSGLGASLGAVTHDLSEVMAPVFAPQQRSQEQQEEGNSFDFLVSLAKLCVDSDPETRPSSAVMVLKIICDYQKRELPRFVQDILSRR